MTGRMQGKVVLVTGAGSVGEGWGNGKAAAVLGVVGPDFGRGIGGIGHDAFLLDRAIALACMSRLV